MGKRGPKPTPINILRRRGSWRGNVKNGNYSGLNSAHKTTIRSPKVPRSLDDTGRKVWRRIVPQLQARGLLTGIDAHVIERYCYLSALYIRTVEFIHKTGGCKIEFDTLPDGRRIIKSVEEFPHVDRLFKIAAALLRIEDSFGMNPSARARIVLPSQEAGERDPEREKANARYFGARQ